MAMKKAEMEEHRASYQSLISEARHAVRNREYRKAIELAESSWEFIPGMIDYESRYEKRDLESVEAIDLVLNHAPLLLEHQCLDAVEELLKSQRRIERKTEHDLADKLARARTTMWNAHRLCDHLERSPGSRQDELSRTLGGDQAQWRSLAEKWEEMGLVRRTPSGHSYRVSLWTQMNETAYARCPACGAIAKSKKAAFLDSRSCPKCHNTVLFVLLDRQPSDSMKE